MNNAECKKDRVSKSEIIHTTNTDINLFHYVNKPGRVECCFLSLPIRS